MKDGSKTDGLSRVERLFYLQLADFLVEYYCDCGKPSVACAIASVTEHGRRSIGNCILNIY